MKEVPENRRDHNDFLHRIARVIGAHQLKYISVKKLIEGDQFWMPRSDYVVNALQTNFMKTWERDMILLLFSYSVLLLDYFYKSFISLCERLDHFYAG